jgi:hypothetical protein
MIMSITVREIDKPQTLVHFTSRGSGWTYDVPINARSMTLIGVGRWGLDRIEIDYDDPTATTVTLVKFP